nr:MAG TPA: hypothetical protein [Caudoviricetes sp.]
MPNLIDAKTAAKNTAAVRNRTREEIKARIIDKINTAIAEGKYYIREYLPDYWSIKELEPFWYYFVSKGYELSIAGVSDFTEAAELYFDKGFLGVTISWGDAS